MERQKIMILVACAQSMFIKGATSQSTHLEKFGLNFLSLSFVIQVNLLHPCSFMV